MSTIPKSPTSTSAVNRFRWGVRSLSSAVLAAVGRDTEPTAHPSLTVGTRLRDDQRAVLWTAQDADGAPRLIRVVRATALPPHARAFQESALELKRLHETGTIPGLCPVLEVSDDRRSYVMPAYLLGTAFEVPVLSWPLPRAIEFFLAVARTVKALNEAGHVIGRWSPHDVLLDDELNPVFAADLDKAKALPFEARERDHFPPEASRDEPLDARADVYTLGKLLKLVTDEPIASLDDAARKSDGIAALTAILDQATSSDREKRQPTVAALIRAVEVTVDLLPSGAPAKDRFELESEPPPRPGAKPAAKPAEKPDPRPSERPDIPTSLRSASMLPSAPARLEPKWLGVAVAAPAVLSALGFFADMPETVASGLSWGAALVAVFATLRATASFPLKASATTALAALLLIVTFDPVGAATGAGVSFRLHGGKAGREKQVKALLDRGRKSFPRQNLSELDLAGANMVMVDVSGADLTNANLTRANLAGMIAEHARVAGANFEGADLRDVDVERMVGWEDARCNGATRFADGWGCGGGRIVKVDAMAKR